MQNRPNVGYASLDRTAVPIWAASADSIRLLNRVTVRADSLPRLPDIILDPPVSYKRSAYEFG